MGKAIKTYLELQNCLDESVLFCIILSSTSVDGGISPMKIYSYRLYTHIFVSLHAV